MANSSGSSDDTTDKTVKVSQEQRTVQADLQRAKDQPACLILIRGTPLGHRFSLIQDEMVVGRDPGVGISIRDDKVSRKHGKLVKEGDQVFYSDLGSSNGSHLNDTKLEANQKVLLGKEDLLKVGNTVFKFLPAGEVEILYLGSLGDAAHTDPLTRIYNKGYLLEALEAEFKRARALHNELSVIFFDLDHFKKINDTYGHDAGDYVLKEVTLLISSSFLRPKDVFARYGGEEFVVLLTNTGGTYAKDQAEKIRAAIESHAFIYEDKRLPVTTSLGVAELSMDIKSATTLLKKADEALYSAKQGGRNRVMVSS